MVQSSLPEWVQYWSTLGPSIAAATTALIGLFVALITWRQWRTAREKLVLDLFERRYRLFDELRAAMYPAARDGGVIGNNAIQEVGGRRDEVKFLFGPDVSEFIEASFQNLVQLQLAQKQSQAQSRGQLSDVDAETNWANLEADCLKRVVKFFEELPRRCMPYMRMHQRYE